MRARNLKPGFFTNDVLCSIQPLGRILFAGLWGLADRKGKLEDRPLRIKAQVLPYDNIDIEPFLCELFPKGFINRYEVSGVKYIEILNFLKHQTPHWQEKDSSIPNPNSSKRKPRVIQDKSKSNRADSLNPDSDGIEPLVDLFNKLCPDLPKVTEVNQSRKTKIKTRLREHDVSWWEGVFRKANEISFSGKNGTEWRPYFDWLFENDQNAVKVIEGNYDNKFKKVSLVCSEIPSVTQTPDWIKEAVAQGWK